jgi:uncharacterized membrane protein YeaQ/YmgE (transglycosylase-associated protein family)
VVNTFVWCAVGLVAGGLVLAARPVPGLVQRAETIAVAVFGAFVGGDFLAAVLGGDAAPSAAFRPASLALAVGGAALMLGLLAWMRRSVGPLRPHKPPRRR